MLVVPSKKEKLENILKEIQSERDNDQLSIMRGEQMMDLFAELSAECFVDGWNTAMQAIRSHIISLEADKVLSKHY